MVVVLMALINGADGDDDDDNNKNKMMKINLLCWDVGN